MYQLNREGMNARESDTLDELSGYYNTEQDMLEAIMRDKVHEIDAIQEMADGRVSVYTGEQIEWLMNNYGKADQEEAIACGAKSAQEIAAWCWYEAERDNIEEDINSVRIEISEVEEEAKSEAL